MPRTLADTLDLRFCKIKMLRKTSFYGSDDKLVIDMGSKFIKYGLSGEPTPRFIIPATDLETDINEIRKSTIIFDEKQRDVVLCENADLNLHTKAKIMDLLLNRHSFQSVTWIPSPLLALIALGSRNGLAIDLGNTHSTVVPVYDLTPLMHYHTIAPLGGEHVTIELRKLLKVNSKYLSSDLGHETNENTPSVESIVDRLSEEEMEDLKTQIAVFKSFEELSTTDFSSNFKDFLRIPGKVRQECTNVLFELGSEEQSISTIFLDSLLKVSRINVVSS